MATGHERSILLAPASDILFHVGRCVVLARELARRGHRVTLAGTPRYLCDPALASGPALEVAELPDFPAEDGMALLRSVRARPDGARLDRMVDAELELLRRLRPDLVVSDFRPTLGISARVCGVPLASLLLSHWTKRYAARPEWVPRSYPAFAWLPRVFGPRLAARIAAPGFALAIRYKSAPIRAAARARGLRHPALLWEQLEGDLNLVTDSESLCPGPLPRDSFRTGPIVWEPDAPLPEELRDQPRDRPVVFVNFGSTGHPDLFRRAFAELGGGAFRVIVATCGQIDPADFEIPRDFHVAKYLPVSRVMAVSDLVVYHGGAGTFHQAIRAGVPGVVVATHWDQEFAGFQTERHGLGCATTLREVQAAPGLLRATVVRALASLADARDRARKLREEVLAYDGPANAADRIEAFLGCRPVPTRS
jgi:UDP:flavonoid glycosyltransferase YjiC (YdhE family)